MKKAYLGLAILILIGVGAYFTLMPKGVVAPAPEQNAAQTVQTETPTTTATQKPSPNTGAGGVYDSNGPAGSSAECFKCSQYKGSQKAQCLAALNCQ